jgi:SAM-dependent methyltransferase
MDSAQSAYDEFARVYDQFTSANNYELWLGEVLLPKLEQHGLQLGRALDIGCGTGRAFDPLLKRGWRVVGCDLSAGMLEQAAQKFPEQVDLFQADARDLDSALADPPEGVELTGFTLVLLLNEVVNYFTQDDDLKRAFSGIAQTLTDDGLVVFDANTLLWFKEVFASGKSAEMSARGWDWHGLSGSVEPGARYNARLSGQGVKARVHGQRHWTQEGVESALEGTELQLLARYGQREERGQVLLEVQIDEERHSKIVHIVGTNR